jgi:hypothetical protein
LRVFLQIKKTCLREKTEKDVTMKKIILVLLTLLSINCVTHQKAEKFSGLPTPDGKPKYYQSTFSIGMNLFVIIPSIRHSEFPESVQAFAENVKKEKGSKFQIIQKESTKWAFILPPVSFIFTPVTTELVGEVYE